MIVDSWL